MSAYTAGEVRALVAPVFDQPAENIVHVTVTCHTADRKTLYFDSAVIARAGESNCSSADVNRAAACHTALNLAGVIQDILEPLAREGEPQ